jgi:8-oxo-dGTP pyrophosphatase MutT (NUDIX family)
MLAHATRNFITESIRSLFGGVPPRIQVAALPWREGESGVEIMLVTSRDSQRWILPKGWPEGEENLSGTAAREALEEAGVSGSVEPREFGRYYYGKKLSSGLEWRCEVLVYPLRVEHVADRWTEMKKRERRWFAWRDAAEAVREPDLGELLSAFASNPKKFTA